MTCRELEGLIGHLMIPDVLYTSLHSCNVINSIATWPTLSLHVCNT